MHAVADAAGPVVAGPTPLAARSLAPDLARGTMLLFIALANAHTFLHLGGWNVRAHPLDGTALDATLSAILTTFVDGRSYPMFAALFGYGMVQILRKQERGGSEWPQARKLLRRRAWWLVLFGFVHAALLFYGDILAAYGLLAVVLVGSLRATGRGLVLRIVVWAAVGSTIYGFFSLPVDGSAEQAMGPAVIVGEENPLVAMALRAGSLLFSAPVVGATAAAAFVVGGWAARHRILEEPTRHLLLLRRTAVFGIGLGVIGGVPLALLIAEVLPLDSSLAFALGALHALTGYAGGLGYAAAVALLAVRLGERRGPVVAALSATGQRSLTCYVLQSVVWQIAFAPYLLDLGTRIGVAATSALALCTWLATVVVAEVLRRLGNRGPLEVLLRRLTYDRHGAAAT